jgi:hypothetical protein
MGNPSVLHSRWGSVAVTVAEIFYYSALVGREPDVSKVPTAFTFKLER